MSERLRLRLIGALALAALLCAAGSADADQRTEIGHSARGRPISGFESGPPDAPLKVLVVGAIHGDETAGMRIARRLIRGAPIARVHLLVVPTINPDGVASGTRGNARGVDLNRNFPYRWRPLGGGEYSGPGPLSEPESRAARNLILREKPDVTIWFHQPFGLIDKPEGNPFAAQRFAQLIGLPLLRLPGPYPGSASRWQNHTFKDSTAFVAELPRRVSEALVKRGTTSVRQMASELASPAVD
ncbi:MAG TPA: M14 family zinc carboxypeptidase [Solirubrobacterales bacterium]